MTDSGAASIPVEEFTADLRRGLRQLAALISRHANDRQLVGRIVMLQRELTRIETAPAPEQVERGLAILRDFIADQKGIASSGTTSRRELVDAARKKVLAVDAPRDVALECAGLSVSYRRGDFALKNVSFSMSYGEITGIVGRNANGKTTLFRLLVGELEPEEGSLRYPAIQADGAPAGWSGIRQQIAYVPQRLPLWYGSLRSNLHYEAAIHGMSTADNEQAVEYIVERLGLRDELDKRWAELSGGFQLRFALARALVWKPRVLLLDEPLANLDPFAQQVLLTDLRQLADSIRFPLAILVSSQHLHEIEEVSDNLLLLSAGNQRFFGPVEELGRHRRVNRFEMSGRDVELTDLEAVFADIPYHSLQYDGVAFVLTASRDVTPATILERLSESPLVISYFRDISRSAKSFLQDDVLQ